MLGMHSPRMPAYQPKFHHIALRSCAKVYAFVNNGKRIMIISKVFGETLLKKYLPLLKARHG